MTGRDVDRQSASLVIRLGALGDMVMLAPALETLARRRGAPCDVISTPLAPAEMLRGLPYVGSVLPLRSRTTPYWVDSKQRRIVSWLRTRPPGPVLVLDPSPKLEWLLDRGGVDPRMRSSARELPREPLEHAAAYALRVVGYDESSEPARVRPPLPFDEQACWANLAVTAAERAECRAWLESLGLSSERLVLFQTLSRNRRRGRWPRDRWVVTVRAVLDALPGARALLLGAWWERLDVRLLAATCRDPRVIDVSGQVPVRRLVALCERAHSCISLDTGPAHVAAAVGCPLVVLVGRADPRRNRPLGPGPKRLVTAWPESQWPATREEWEAEHRLAALSPAAVLDAWREVALKPAAASGGQLRG